MTETITEYVKRAGITLEAVPGPTNQHLPDPEMGHFTVTLTNARGDRITTPYSVGVGILEWWGNENLKGAMRALTGLNRRCLAYESEWAKIKPRIMRGYKPDADEILDCLVSDASCVIDLQSFSEFAQDMGYEMKDLEKAEQAYRACQDTARQLKRFLGADFDHVLYEVERM